MAKEKNLVEDALIQMRNLEEAVAENAKGILASTMKQEIRELVKESIVSEQGDDDEEIKTDDEMDMDMDSDEMDMDMDSDDEMDMDMDSDEMDMDMDSDMSDIGMSDDDDIIDLSGTDSDGEPLISDEDLLKVFLSMDQNDGIIVKKDNNMVNLKDDNTDKEYLIQMESAEGDEFMDMGESYEDDEMDMDDEDDSMEMEESYEDDSMGMEESYEEMEEADMDIDSIINSVFGSKDSEESYGEDEEEEEVVYELEMDDDDLTEEDDFQMESTTPKVGKGVKSIGKKTGFSYEKTSRGFKEDMKQGTRGVGMGKPKFEFKEGMKKEKMDDSKLMRKGKPSSMFYSGKKEETKEASRTYKFGSKDGSRGLRKGITPNRNLTFENEQKYEEQIKVLREKNEEYRKALNVFRDKLNEVATFNSNLAYATRLFTEHSTSKQEKINILRRFDDVETIKESKNLYRTIKSELTTTNKTSITESIEGRIEKTPSSGSASTLIESKTYENPQFLRMKDIMSKIIK
jgi:hypothetical protein